MRSEPQEVEKVTRKSLPIKEGVDDLQYKCKLQPGVKFFQDFVRTVNKWNKIPYEVRNCDSLDYFEVLLKEHLWLILSVKPDEI